MLGAAQGAGGVGELAIRGTEVVQVIQFLLGSAPAPTTLTHASSIKRAKVR